MPGVDVAQVAGLAVVDRVEKSHVSVIDLERRRHHLGCEVYPFLYVLETRRAAHRGANRGHHDGRGQALAHDVAKRDGDVSKVGLIPVVEVAADLARGGEVGSDLEPLTLQRRRRQHAGLQRRGPRHLVGTLRDHRLEPFEIGTVFELEAAAPERVDAGQVQLGGSDRLHVVAVRSVVDGGPAQLRVVDARDHHDRRLRDLFVQLAQQPVAGLVGQADVHEHERVVELPETLSGLRAGEGNVGFEAAAAQCAGHRLRQRLFVLDDQEPLPVTSVPGVHRPRSVRGANPGLGALDCQSCLCRL